MIRRFHGIDRHKKYSTISVLDRDGKEVRFLRSCSLEGYLSSLGADDAVILAASCGCFHWADRIEASAATCFVLDPRRFRIITDSWNKTDRQDARNMAKALWVYLVTGEFGIPTVYSPDRDNPHSPPAASRSLMPWANTRFRRRSCRALRYRQRSCGR